MSHAEQVKPLLKIHAKKKTEKSQIQWTYIRKLLSIHWWIRLDECDLNVLSSFLYQENKIDIIDLVI